MRRGRRSIITAQVRRACGEVDAHGSSTSRPFTAPEMFQAANSSPWLIQIGVVKADQHRVSNMAPHLKPMSAFDAPSLVTPWPPAHLQPDFVVRIFPVGRLTDHVASLMAFDFSDAPAVVRRVTLRGSGLLSSYTGTGAPGASTIAFARTQSSQGAFWVVGGNGQVQAGQTWLGRRGAHLPPCINSLHLLAGNAYTVTSYDEAGQQIGRFHVVLRQGMLTANLVEREEELFARALTLNLPLAQLRAEQAVTLNWAMPLCMPQASSIQRVTLHLTGSDGLVYISQLDDGRTVFAGPSATLLVPTLPDGVRVVSCLAQVCLRGVGLAQFITETPLT
jgi:hypothetical protein